jgi:hypothetical protein
LNQPKGRFRSNAGSLASVHLDVVHGLSDRGSYGAVTRGRAIEKHDRILESAARREGIF